MSSNHGLNLDELADVAKVEYPDAPRSSSDQEKNSFSHFSQSARKRCPIVFSHSEKIEKIRFSQRGTQTDVIASERATGFYDQSIISSSLALSHRFFLYFVYLNTSTRSRECCESRCGWCHQSRQGSCGKSSRNGCHPPTCVGSVFNSRNRHKKNGRKL